MKSKRTQALAISRSVKERVWERDGRKCVVCGCIYASPAAHFIPRSKGGLGIEENIVTLCQDCHRRFDQGRVAERREMFRYLRDYLRACYPDWDSTNITYRKDY